MKILSFGLLGLLTVVLALATVVEQVWGTAVSIPYIYSAPWTVVLWGIVAVSAIGWLIQRKQWRRPWVFVLHLSLAVILLGALVTWLSGERGSVHLRLDGDGVQAFRSDDGQTCRLPFTVALSGFTVEYYPGTHAPMDYVSRVQVTDGHTRTGGSVSMNHVYTYRHYRFYQSTYDRDGQGATLAVSHDPWGIGITYAGYALLLVGWIGLFLSSGSEFRRLLRHPLLHRGSALAVCLLCGTSLSARTSGEAPRVLPAEVAEAFGRLYVYHNNRICPLQTLAREFTQKLCGRATYRGYTAEQVFTGWFFYYDDWKSEPVITIKGRVAREALGLADSRASLADFVGSEGYKLDTSGEGVSAAERKTLREADEKFRLVSMLATGNLLRIYPYRSPGSGRVEWLSMVDDRPDGIDDAQWLFIRKGMGLVAEQIARGDHVRTLELLHKVRAYQEREAAGVLPSPARFEAELWYNKLKSGRLFAFVCLGVGLLAFVGHVRRMVDGSVQIHRGNRVLGIGLWLVLAYLVCVIGLRGYVAGHVPLSNGYETMQAMAACTVACTFVLRRRFALALPFGYLLCGLCLLVAMMGEGNPPVTPLMPVLSSPLLSFHVAAIMVAYSLLAFILLNGVTAEVLHRTRGDHRNEVERLYVLSRLLLYPAVALLAVGIFIGAVWANVSWGRYWGWDPKEVWALITLLVYASALHAGSLPLFRRPMAFHRFSVIAFLSVLVTYFGVNFLMAGLHSYA